MLKSIFSTIVLLVTISIALAQSPERINFAVEGPYLVWEQKVGANGTKEFVFNATKGQKFSASFIDDTQQGSMNFGKISIEPNAQDPFTMVIPETKEYRFSISNNTSKATSFRISVSLEGAPKATNPNNLSMSIPYGKTASIESHNYSTHFIRHAKGLGFKTAIKTDLDKKDATFFVIKGLANSNDGFVSLESSNYRGQFLRHQKGRIKISRNEGDLFKKDATFKVVPGLSDPKWVSFESVNYPGYFLRHRNGELWIDKNNGSALFKTDATWRFTAPKN